MITPAGATHCQGEIDARWMSQSLSVRDGLTSDDIGHLVHAVTPRRP
jgi:hypothetical protein